MRNVAYRRATRFLAGSGSSTSMPSFVVVTCDDALVRRLLDVPPWLREADWVSPADESSETIAAWRRLDPRIDCVPVPGKAICPKSKSIVSSPGLVGRGC